MANQVRDADAERRGCPRRVCGPDCWVRLRPAAMARVVNLGIRGVLVETRARLIPGSMTSIVVRRGEGTSAIRARISRSSVAAFVPLGHGEAVPVYRTGLEFVSPSTRDVTAIEQLVATLVSAPAGPDTQAAPPAIM